VQAMNMNRSDLE